jgi:hypothetical protein
VRFVGLLWIVEGLGHVNVMLKWGLRWNIVGRGVRWWVLMLLWKLRKEWVIGVWDGAIGWVVGGEIGRERV